MARVKKKPLRVSRFIFEDTIETKMMTLKGESFDSIGINYEFFLSENMLIAFLQPPLDLLLSYLFHIRIKKVHNGIFKQECCLSFDTPDYVRWNYEKTGNAVYLLIKQKRQTRLVPKGVDGGFGNDDPEYMETLGIVILPEYFSLPFSDMKLLEKVRLAIGAILLADGAEWKDQMLERPIHGFEGASRSLDG